MRVLLVSYVFPPFGGAGVQRISKLAEFLVARGHIVSIITHHAGFVQDADLVSDGIKDLAVLRVTFSEHHAIDDGKISPELANFVVHNDPEVILSSSPTIEAHFLAKKLKNICVATWIADFRDIQSEYVSRFNFFTRREVARIERGIVESCDAVVVISEYHKNYLMQRYALPKHKVTVVMNGYDADDFAKVVRESHNSLMSLTPTLILTHVGTFYEKRSPLFLIINSIIAKKKLGIDLRLKFVGKMGGVARFITRSFQRFISIEVVDSVSHGKAIQIMCQADVLILVPGWFGVGVITGKVFEYVASGSPVINLYTYKGPLTEMLANVEGAFNVHEFDTRKFIKVISTINQSRTVREYNRLNFTKYERSNQYKLLEQVMLSINLAQ